MWRHGKAGSKVAEQVFEAPTALTQALIARYPVVTGAGGFSDPLRPGLIGATAGFYFEKQKNTQQSWRARIWVWLVPLEKCDPAW